MIILCLFAVVAAQRWGTFKPSCYFCLKDIENAVKPQSLCLFWVVKDWRTDLELARYRVQQAKYENVKVWYEYHDGSTFVKQIIEDTEYNTRITTQWVLQDNNWHLKIDLEPIDQSRSIKAQPFIFLKKSDNNTLYNLHRHESGLRIVRQKEIELFEFFDIKADETKIISLNMEIQDVQQFLSQHARQLVQQPQVAELDPNFVIVQFRHHIDIKHGQSQTKSEARKLIIQDIQPPVEQFHQRLSLTLKNTRLAQLAVSNLMGNLGHFYGPLRRYQRSMSGHTKITTDDYDLEMISFCQGKTVYCAPHVYEQGFDLLLACVWDDEICSQVLKSWIYSINKNGWIPLQQPRGEMVPDELSSTLDQGVPPSLILCLQFLHQRPWFPEVIRGFEAWFSWFDRILQNYQIPCTFAYKNRNEIVNEDSQLYDYPRAIELNPDYEIHLDLQSWMTEFARIMRDITRAMGKPWQVYDQKYKCWRNKLKDLLDEQSNLFKDYMGLQNEPNQLQQEKVEFRADMRCGPNYLNLLGQPAKCLLKGNCCKHEYCEIDPVCDCESCQLHSQTHHTYRNQLSTHLGIVNLFPLIFQQASDQLESIVKLIESQMISDYGLLSLSKFDQYFMQETNFFRGHVHISLNYLVLKGLRHYKHQEIYNKIRNNLLDNVSKQLELTGQFWEYYDARDGKGLGITGYAVSSLIALIESEVYF